VTVLREEVEGNTLADTTSATATLSCVRLGDESLDKAADLALLIESKKWN
jgi:hypothetical protein